MDQKSIKKLVALKDTDKVIEWLKENGWTEAKHTSYLGNVSLIDLFNAKELYVSQYARLDGGNKRLQAVVYDDVSTAKDWLWFVLCEDKKFNQGLIPSRMCIYVKSKTAIAENPEETPIPKVKRK